MRSEPVRQDFPPAFHHQLREGRTSHRSPLHAQVDVPKAVPSFSPSWRMQNPPARPFRHQATITSITTTTTYHPLHPFPIAWPPARNTTRPRRPRPRSSPRRPTHLPQTNPPPTTASSAAIVARVSTPRTRTARASSTTRRPPALSTPRTRFLLPLRPTRHAQRDGKNPNPSPT